MLNTNILNYRILSKIGEGGMGTVYLGTHLTLDRKVAIKMLLPELSNNQQIKDRFINEAKTLSKLNHQNIVALYDFTTQDNSLFLIMEYVEGIPLDKLIENVTGPIPAPRCIAIFEQILSGFSYAHKKGIIHRDIKPSNIILQSDDTPKILDFGIAKIVEGDVKLTKTGTRMGSIAYMSPEQVMGREIDLRSDIYSLGMTLFEMLSGKLPYDTTAESEFEIQCRIVKEPLPQIRTINPDVSENLQNIILKATEKDSNYRFQNCEEFKGALISVSFSHETQTYNENQLTRTKIQNAETNHEFPEKKKNRLIIPVSIVSSVVLVIIMFFVLSSGNEQVEVKTVTQSNTKVSQNNFQSDLSDEQKTVTDRLKQWINDLNNLNTNIYVYYADRVNYFGGGVISRDKLYDDKMKFYKKWDKIELVVEGLSVEKLSSQEYVCHFDKYFRMENSFSGKIYDGKVRSRIKFEKISGNWLITGETDDKVYYTNKH